MAQPLVSILVPCRNAAPWLEQALRSVTEQTWKQWELIVVDDGSTDASPGIAGRFASPRCQVLRQENQGASRARNRAFECAQGDFIQYLDADDFLAPDKLTRQLEAASGGDAETLTFGSVIHLLESIETGPRRLSLARLSYPTCKEPIPFLTDLWEQRFMVQTGQWLVPRSLVEKAGPWDERLTLDDDGEFFARVVLQAREIVPVPEALCFYRKFRHGGNLSASGPRHRKFLHSAMLSAQMKAGHLLARSDDSRARSAAARLVTDCLVEGYPTQPNFVRQGLRFLDRHRLEFALPLAGPHWFLHAYPKIGWRAARRLQHYARKWRGILQRPGDHSSTIST